MSVTHLQHSIEPLRQQLIKHAVYQKINSPDQLQDFMEYHVFAVWDFMSLLKALQAKLTSIGTPWFPSENREIRYLINEMVLAEESDKLPDGGYSSHFEMYLSAMEQAGASTAAILHFLEQVKSTQNVFVAIRRSNLPDAVKSFLNFTFQCIEEGKIHCIAAAFTFGREDLIPDMFTEIIRNIQEQFPASHWSELLYYMERHVELDADEHGPMALRMMQALCGENAQYWQEATETAKAALEHRLALWEAIETVINEKDMAPSLP
ncbi:MAG: heme oxygenase [Flavobacterium sp. BFFFF2]|nr:MAG: heme oxygenase [Flavobacterium sp. BFFFF2]